MVEIVFLLVILAIAGSEPEEDKWFNRRNEK